MSRDFDVILWGATGFTGRLVAEYLNETYGVGKDVRWAIAGRNVNKLEALRTELTARNPDAAGLDIIRGDSHDAQSLHQMAARASVICTTVGPYAKYGSKLVAACVAEGTDYCDLTGETPWIQDMIEQHHEGAKEKGCRIVHCCGFDSIPSDMGTHFLQREAKREHGAPLDTIGFYLGKSKGGVSGGTVASMLNIASNIKDPKIRKALMDPYALNPKGERSGPDGRDQMGVQWDEDAQVWTGPFVMASINTRIVRRSNALTDYAYGRDFRYKEVTSRPKGARNYAISQQLAVGQNIFLALAAVGPVRKLMQATILPDPGEGPDEHARVHGYFNIRFVGQGKDRSGNPVKMEARVSGDRDPGYGSTSKMLAESALCLALDKDKLPEQAGVLTPASAMGDALLDRLPTAGLSFSLG